jgi:hypothetical protein
MNRGRHSNHAQQPDVNTPIHPIRPIYRLPLSRLFLGRSNPHATRGQGELGRYHPRSRDGETQIELEDFVQE